MSETPPNSRGLARWLWRKYLRRHIWLLAVALVFMSLEGAMYGAISYMMKPMFDQIFIGGQGDKLVLVGLAILGIFALRATASVVQKVVLTRLAQVTSGEIRTDLVDHLMTLEGQFHQTHSPGYLMQRIEGDVGSINKVWKTLVTGAGRAFCAGMDLSAEGNVFGLDESVRPTPEEFRAAYDEPPYDEGVRDTGGKVTLAIHALPKPVIAAINGPAVGIGATMTLAMDLRLASTKARIGFVFGRLGIVPEACSTWFLPRLVGPQRALEWIYSAEVLTAEQALEGGLLRSVHEPDDLLPTALELARSFVKDRSPMALALAKQMVYRNGAAAHPLEAHLSDSLAMYWTSMGDGKEGVAAFLDKRAPEFTRKASQAPRIYPT